MPPGLRGFYASDNEIASVPPAFASRSSMAELDLRRNRISELPVSLSAWGRLDYLNLAGNPLPLPPEVLAQCEEPAAIVDYVSRTLRLAKPLDEAKLLIVGEGSVGKSSLIKRLVNDVFDPQQGKTDGIDVTRWPIDVNGVRVVLNVWDFGGQEIMHATHQFFLTERSVYVLVLDVRQGEAQNRLEYWLKLIQSFSGGSPVIIVGNKTDQASLDIDVRGLMTKYPNIVAILPASCCTGTGIATVREMLVDVVASMDHVHDLLPGSFFDIKNELEQLEENYLPFTEYQALCRRHNVSSQVTQELLVKFLHDLGTVVCFRDDPRLSDTNILNPAWVTGGVYKILNAHLSAQRKGLLSWTHINQILAHDDYPPERRQFIVDMMKRFELCYESEGVFLVPDLLTKEEPDTGSWAGALEFEISYDVLPTSILSRLMVRMHSVISKSTVWRTGVVFAVDHNRALVKADLEDAVIKISVAGPENGRRGLLTAIRTELRGIEKTIPGLAGEERVPVPGRPGIWVPYQHLIELEAAGRREVVPQGLSEDFDISDLLAGVETRPKVRTEVLRPGIPRWGGSVDGSAGEIGRVWSPHEGMGFVRQLLVVLVVSALVAVFAYRQVGSTAAMGVCTAALVAVSILGIFALRSTGRLSEGRFAQLLSSLLKRR
jgi:small GTP-binding protein